MTFDNMESAARRQGSPTLQAAKMPPSAAADSEANVQNGPDTEGTSEEAREGRAAPAEGSRRDNGDMAGGGIGEGPAGPRGDVIWSGPSAADTACSVGTGAAVSQSLVSLFDQTLSFEEEGEPWENRVREAADRDGESLITLGPAPPDELAGFAERLQQVAETVACACTVIHTVDSPAKEGVDGKGKGKGGDGRGEAGVEQDDGTGRDTLVPGIGTGSCTGTPGAPREVRRDPPLRTMYCMVRKLPAEGHHLDLRVAVVGNVDAGKSTLVGVLTGPVSFLDDGRGLARSKVLRHKHEAETGRTSSIAEDQHMRLRCPWCLFVVGACSSSLFFSRHYCLWMPLRRQASLSSAGPFCYIGWPQRKPL